MRAYRSTGRNYHGNQTMIEPIGGSPPDAQTLSFLGHLTAQNHSDKLLFPPNYDPDNYTIKYDMGIFCRGKASTGDQALNVIKGRLQAAMPSTIRNVIALFPECGADSWYTDNLIADTNKQGVGAKPYWTLINTELLDYVTRGVQWSGRFFIVTFSMGGQFLKILAEQLARIRAVMVGAIPRARHDFGGPWVGSDATLFSDIWGDHADNPALNDKYVLGSPQTTLTSNATAIKAAITANRLRLRFGCGADDPTLAGHNALLTGVLDAQGIPYSKPTPDGVNVDSNGNYIAVDHNWPNGLDKDPGFWTFLESGLAVPS